jgi:hypothetical protein
LLQSELSILRWFRHTAVTTAHFYEAHELRNCAAGKPSADFWIRDKAACERRLRDVVADEERNTRDALKVVESDVRLDFYYHPFLAVSHTTDMLHEKLRWLEKDRQTLRSSRN